MKRAILTLASMGITSLLPSCGSVGSDYKIQEGTYLGYQVCQGNIDGQPIEYIVEDFEIEIGAQGLPMNGRSPYEVGDRISIPLAGNIAHLSSQATITWMGTERERDSMSVFIDYDLRSTIGDGVRGWIEEDMWQERNEPGVLRHEVRLAFIIDSSDRTGEGYVECEVRRDFY